MSKTAQIYPQARTWRDIPQQVRPRAMSRGGRRRKIMTSARIVGAIAVIGLLAGGVAVFTKLFKDDPARISSAVNAVPLKSIVLRTDGVLDQAWAERTLNLPKQASLLELDLLQLREKLLANPQVRSATLTRKFPATLEITISERSPVALVNAQLGEAQPRPYLVARDGVVFAGVNFDPESLRVLPWLDGIKLMRTGDRFVPIPGMDAVADLLATARNEAPHLYHDWQVVSLERLDRDGEIVVHTATVKSIVFTTRSQDDFLHQLAQLDVLLDTARARTDQPIDEINLAVGRTTDGLIQVPVTFVAAETAKGTTTRSGARTPPALAIPLFKSSRQTAREL